MKGPGYWWRKCRLLFGRARFSGELDEEMAFHREQMAKELQSEGMTPGAARSAAMRQFGNAMRMRERSHEVVGFRAETVAHDLRYGIRQLRKSPGFAGEFHSGATGGGGESGGSAENGVKRACLTGDRVALFDAEGPLGVESGGAGSGHPDSKERNGA